MPDLGHNLDNVRAAIAAAAARVRRDPAGIELIAVSKTHPAESLLAVAALGHTTFGENYAQELAAKASALKGRGLRFVYVGALQSNKIKLLVEHADEIQTVASAAHAAAIARAATATGKTPYPVYIAVNAGGEAQKHGISAEGVPPLAAAIAAMPELQLKGIMSVPPPLPTPVDPTPPPLYLQLAALARTAGAGGLSLGMTADLVPAIAAGSTCVRIGTAIFGARSPKPR
jgi:pyridoxal phosphate enzyme (YggS family)